MPSRTRIYLLLAGLTILLLSCQDVPTQIADPLSTEPAFARGGGKGKGGGEAQPPPVTAEALGALLFADRDLSVHQNEACQSCHEPSQGFAAPLTGVTTQGSVVQGSQAGQFGNRKPPTAAYATLSPLFSGSGSWGSGGVFWDGRATGELLGNPAADQALGPFLNPKEQGMPDKACVIWRVSHAGYYATDWEPVWGDAVSGISWADAATVCVQWTSQPGELVDLSPVDRATVNEAYNQVALSIAAFEATLNTFSSRFDEGQLTAQEQSGEKIFSSNGKCQQCHVNKGSEAPFTDFQFHNLGVPANPDNPAYTPPEFDPGLGGFTSKAAHLGKFRTPTVRNVAVGDNRTYMHNGALKSLRQVVQFYNTRDVLRVCSASENDPARWGPTGPDALDAYGCWPPPEYAGNLDTKRMGNLGLSDDEVSHLVAYLEAMSDAGLAP